MTAAPAMPTHPPAHAAPLLAAAELWTASPEGPRLQEGCYGPHDGLRAAGANTRLQPGEGAIGEAFESGTPRLVGSANELGVAYREAAADTGVEAAILLPFLSPPGTAGSGDAGGEVQAVLSLMLRGERVGDASSKGAAELWAGTKGRFELSLEQSHHVNLDRFARVSQFVNFPMGAGLPGLCWQNATAELVPDVGTAKGFLRSSGAESDGLSVGLGLPLLRGAELRAVLLLISSNASPFAVVHEVWKTGPDADGPLVRNRGTYGGHVELAEATRGLEAAGAPSIERARATGLPVLLDGADALAAHEPARAAALEAAGLTRAVIIPVPTLHGVRSVAALYL